MMQYAFAVTRHFAATCAAVWLSFTAAPSSGYGFAGGDDLKERGEQLIERARQGYRSLQSYGDRLEMTMSVQFEDDDDGMWAAMMGTIEPQVTTLAIAQPNRIALVSEFAELFCDGENLWIVLPMLGQYMQTDAPDSWLSIAQENEVLVAQFFRHPVLSLASVGPDDSTGANLQTVERVEAKQYNGRAGTQIVGTMAWEAAGMYVGEPLPITMWFDDETGLLGRYTVDMTAMQNELADGAAQEDDEDDFARPRFAEFVAVMALHDIQINPDLPAEQFVFTPDAVDRKVDQFDFGGRRSHAHLIGKEAPDFSGPLFDQDVQLALADLRGSVVLLDFWATWCGPCLQAMPQIQALADMFADRPVVVLGVNQDQPNMDERIRRALQQREITFPHVLDAEGHIGEAYEVQGIPMVVLIDGNGIVQDVAVGFPPGKEKDLAAKIERLLEGENLFDDEELAALREAGEDQPRPRSRPRQRRADAEAHAAVAELVHELFADAPQRLTEISSPQVFTGLQTRILMDVTGDGELEIVIPDHQGALHVSSLSGDFEQRVRLRGLPRNAMIEAFYVVHHNGECYWAVSVVRHSMRGASDSMLGLFDSSGQLLWSYEPGVSRSTNVSFNKISVGDVTGNGVPEIVAAMNVYQLQPQGDHFTHVGQSVLLVFDVEGHLLSYNPGLGQHVSLLHVHEAESGPATIVYVADGYQIRLRWDALSASE